MAQIPAVLAGPNWHPGAARRIPHRPPQESHPGGVHTHRGQHRQQLVEHHRTRVPAGRATVPVGVAAVDADHRERWLALLDQAGQPLLDAEIQHHAGVAVLAMQCDHWPQLPALAGRHGDHPVGLDASASRRDERAGDPGRQAAARRRGSNGAGAACGSSGSTRAPKAHTPAAPAPAPAPQRSRARRVRSAMGVMMPRRSVLPAQPRRSTGQS